MQNKKQTRQSPTVEQNEHFSLKIKKNLFEFDTKIISDFPRFGTRCLYFVAHCDFELGSKKYTTTHSNVTTINKILILIDFW